jgi:prepilin-type N-terminal cleavage/methylation domain-containing protein
MKHTATMKKGLPAKVGFTLIELLIVIALLGALAVGLLATIDPFEQLKKGRDTSQRNTVSEFYNANLRYYATKAAFPWGEAGVTGTISALSGHVSTLVAAGELKDKFMELAGQGNLAKIYVTSTDATHVNVCFIPESKSFQSDPNTIYLTDGSNGPSTGGSACRSYIPANSTINCAFCVQ